MPTPNYSTMSLHAGITPSVDQDHAIPNVATKVNYLTKTAAYACTRGDSGTHFSNLGAAGSVTFTLPAVATSAGCEYWFHTAVAAQNLVVTAPAGTLVAYNNVAATSVSLVTASNIAGACIHVFCDGTKWLSGVRIENIAVTITVA
jgi:hypothetical protein